jgi:hypothetical protein
MASFSVPNTLWAAFVLAMQDLGCKKLSVIKRTSKVTSFEVEDMSLVAKAMKAAAQNVAALSK